MLPSAQRQCSSMCACVFPLRSMGRPPDPPPDVQDPRRRDPTREAQRGSSARGAPAAPPEKPMCIVRQRGRYLFQRKMVAIPCVSMKRGWIGCLFFSQVFVSFHVQPFGRLVLTLGKMGGPRNLGNPRVKSHPAATSVHLIHHQAEHGHSGAPSKKNRLQDSNFITLLETSTGNQFDRSGFCITSLRTLSSATEWGAFRVARPVNLWLPPRTRGLHTARVAQGAPTLRFAWVSPRGRSHCLNLLVCCKTSKSYPSKLVAAQPHKQQLLAKAAKRPKNSCLRFIQLSSGQVSFSA